MIPCSHREFSKISARLTRVLVVGALIGIALTAFPSQAQTDQPLPPTPTAVCAPAPRSRLIVHERAIVLTDDPRPLNLRDSPSTNGHMVAQIPTNSILYVLEGPKCSQSYAWYRVEYDGKSGWIAEGDKTAYFVGVYPPGW